MFSFICLRRAAFFAAKESGKRNRQRGPIPRRSPLETLPTAKAGPAGPSIGSSPGLRRFYERREKLSLNTQAFGRWALHIATFSLRKAPVPRSLEGGSNGGNRRAVSPLAGRRGSWGNHSEGSPMRAFGFFPRVRKEPPRGERPAREKAAEFNGIVPVSAPHPSGLRPAAFPQGKADRAAGQGDDLHPGFPLGLRSRGPDPFIQKTFQKKKKLS